MSEVKRYNAEIWPHEAYIDECDDGEYVKYEDYAALKAEHDALAAENAASRQVVQTFCDVVGSNTDVLCEEFGTEGVHAILAAMRATGNMPATDAFLLNAQADGVDKLGEYYNFSTPMLVQVEAKHFAKKLRAQAEALKGG